MREKEKPEGYAVRLFGNFQIGGCGFGICCLTLFALIILFIADPHGSAMAQSSPALAIGIDEVLGEQVPLDISFMDEAGNSVRLGDLIDRPTIVVLVYYRCPGICPLLLNGTVEVLSKLQLDPGVDYKVLSISFDETDDSEGSRQKKLNYLHSLPGFPEDAWRFLTGDLKSIEAFTDATGFRFQRQGFDFAHPSALIVLSKEGKISRYLYGTDFLPFDLKMALIEASEGRVGPTINRVLKLCFSYDPEGRTYVLNVTRVAGSIVILLALIFLTVLLVKGRVQSKKAS